jgi:hypothetical protein
MKKMEIFFYEDIKNQINYKPLEKISKNQKKKKSNKIILHTLFISNFRAENSYTRQDSIFLISSF